MAIASKRPAMGKPAPGSVEDLRSRAAALREEADRLVAAAETRAKTSPVDGESKLLPGNGKVHHDVNRKVTSAESGDNAARVEHLRLDRNMGRHEIFGDASPIADDFVAALSRSSSEARPDKWIILDTRLCSLTRELVAIEAEQDAVLEAGSYADAYDSPGWVRLERHRESILERVIATRAHTMEGLKAKGSLFALNSIKHHQQPIEQLALSIAADLKGMEGGGDGLAHDDAALIQACDGAVRIFDMLNGPLSSLPEDAFNACMAQNEKLIEIAIATPATTREGLAGKARILKNEWPCNARDEQLDNGDRLIRSLVWDLAGKEARA